MLLVIISWILITSICFSWGALFIRLISGTFIQPNIHFSITCLAGCVIISAFYSTISFFSPLGNILIHLPLLVPVIILLLSHKKINLHFLWKEFCRLTFLLKILLLLVLSLIVIMSSWYITHPDSMGYHLQIIKWIEKFRIVPGIANLNPRLGFQSLWFVLSAIFSYNFTGVGSYIYLNSTVILWFIIFITYQINEALALQYNTRAILWIFLLFLSFFSYTQIRLTATSPSPDFIVAIYLLVVFFLLLSMPVSSATQSLVIIFSFFAVTIKLSASPILVPAFFIIFKIISEKQIKKLFGPVLIIFVLLFSFLIRNIITSGFLLYPSTFPDIVTKEWKTDKYETDLQASYVTTYARIESDLSQKAIEETKNMKIDQWLPVWWHQRNLPDKAILLLLLPALIFLPLYIIIKRRNLTTIEVVGILTSMVGVVFWFIMAPHPRFGFGFILAAIGIAAKLSLQNTSFKIKKGTIVILLLLGNIALAGYIIYRGQHFFSEKQIIKPLGIHPISYSLVKLKNITLKFPQSSSMGCGTIPPPCIDSTGTEALPIGNKIEDGFFTPKNDH